MPARVLHQSVSRALFLREKAVPKEVRETNINTKQLKGTIIAQAVSLNAAYGVLCVFCFAVLLSFDSYGNSIVILT